MSFAQLYDSIAKRGDDGVWIYRPPLEELEVSGPADAGLPLAGLPFAVKDNIDVAGWPTTAGCREYTYMAEQDAEVVARLRAAGAIPVGKTNMDQFATGLTGTRSPYGVPSSVFHPEYISGGSSSGSAVAVAAGLVPFSLGTDTAGSGRVPAACNGIVGWKPTRGLLSTRGVVPACRSLDCVSVFSRTVAQGEAVLAAAGTIRPMAIPETLRFGVPAEAELEFFGDREAEALYREAIARMEALGHRRVDFDYGPFREAARLLYGGPWVAERMAAIEPFFRAQSDRLHPVVREIIAGADRFSAADAFRGAYELERLRAFAAVQWAGMDLLLLPTTGTTYRIAEVLANPIELNSNLGYYTNFVNLLDLCALAVPAGVRAGNGQPFGVTFMAPAFHEALLATIGRAWLGEPAAASRGGIQLAVVGAHLSGQPLNRQLTERGARLLRTCRTAHEYRLYALANTAPPKPGLVREPGYAGEGIEVEVWSMTTGSFGDFTAQVPAPMVIGNLELEDGSSCKGFLCEPCALSGAEEITRYGGWRAYLARG